MSKNRRIFVVIPSAMLAVVVLLLFSVPAKALCGKMNGCGVEQDFAQTFFAVPASQLSGEDKIRCYMRMLGLLMCVRNNAPRSEQMQKALGQMLHRAGASKDARLRCLSQKLQTGHSPNILPKAAPRPATDPLKTGADEANELISRYCSRQMLHDGANDEIRMIGPGRLLLKQCRPGKLLN